MTKGEPLSVKTNQDVLKHLKNKNMFCQINKLGTHFQNAMFIYMADFMAQEIVPDTYDCTRYTAELKG